MSDPTPEEELEYAKAVVLVDKYPDDPELRSMRAPLLQAYRDTLRATGGPADDLTDDQAWTGLKLSAERIVREIEGTG